MYNYYFEKRDSKKDDYIFKNYIGHFTTTPLFKGNVELITSTSLETIKKNDEIKYNFMFGEKTYIVEEFIEIQDNYYNYLEDTKNINLTLSNHLLIFNKFY